VHCGCGPVLPAVTAVNCSLCVYLCIINVVPIVQRELDHPSDAVLRTPYSLPTHRGPRNALKSTSSHFSPEGADTTPLTDQRTAEAHDHVGQLPPTFSVGSRNFVWHLVFSTGRQTALLRMTVLSVCPSVRPSLRLSHS